MRKSYTSKGLYNVVSTIVGKQWKVNIEAVSDDQKMKELIGGSEIMVYWKKIEYEKQNKYWITKG